MLKVVLELKKKREPAFIHPGQLILLPIVTSCALSSLGAVARNFAFCGPAVGIKEAKLQQQGGSGRAWGRAAGTRGPCLGLDMFWGARGDEPRPTEASVNKEGAAGRPAQIRSQHHSQGQKMKPRQGL